MNVCSQSGNDSCRWERVKGKSIKGKLSFKLFKPVKKKMKNVLVQIILIYSVLTACVPAYKGIMPDRVDYPEIYDRNQRIHIIPADTSFLTSRLKPKKELHFVPVKVINDDTLPYTINRSTITVFNDFEPTEIISFDEYYRHVKHKSAIYIIVGSAGIVMGLGISNRGLHPSLKNPGWLLPLGSTGYIVAASRANKKLRNDLLNYDLLDMVIKPGTEVNGFLCISARALNTVTIRIER